MTDIFKQIEGPNHGEMKRPDVKWFLSRNRKEINGTFVVEDNRLRQWMEYIEELEKRAGSLAQKVLDYGEGKYPRLYLAHELTRVAREFLKWRRESEGK